LTYLPAGLPAAIRDDQRLHRLMGDVELFAKLHKVQHKDTKQPIPFAPLPMQEKIFRAVKEGHKRILVVKARQVAATTGAKMVMHHLATTTEHAAMHAVVSMRADSASSLLDDHRRWTADLPTALQRSVKVTRTGLTWADTGASIRAFTSRSNTGLRSFSPAAALISEAAYAPDLEEVLAQVDAAVGPHGLIIMESTAANPDDFFSRLVKSPGAWHLLTHWWWEHPAYRSPTREDSTPAEGEAQAVARYHLDPEQVQWRRDTIGRLGSYRKFRREFPADIDDALIDIEGSYFDGQVLENIDVLDFTLTPDRREIEAPHPHDRYVVGVDVGGGTGGDYSALAVVSVGTHQPVYMERSNRLTPQQWAHRVIQVATRYNRALVLTESNNHGHAVLLELNNCGYREQWRDPKTSRPWTTTLQSKLDAYNTLREALPLVRLLDRTTHLELRALTVMPGKIAPESPAGGHDDSAMALALGYRCLRDVPANWRNAQDAAAGVRVQELLAANRARRIRASGNPFSNPFSR